MNHDNYDPPPPFDDWASPRWDVWGKARGITDEKSCRAYIETAKANLKSSTSADSTASPTAKADARSNFYTAHRYASILSVREALNRCR